MGTLLILTPACQPHRRPLGHFAHPGLTSRCAGSRRPRRHFAYPGPRQLLVDSQPFQPEHLSFHDKAINAQDRYPRILTGAQGASHSRPAAVLHSC